MTRPLRLLAAAFTFGCRYLKDVVLCNLRVARDVLASRPRLSPGIVAVPLGDMSDRQVLVLAILLTMTPGTLSLEVDESARVLYLHCLYTEPGPAQIRSAIRENYERPIRLLF